MRRLLALALLLGSCAAAREDLVARGELRVEAEAIPEHEWQVSAFVVEPERLVVEGRLRRRSVDRQRYLGEVVVRLESRGGETIAEARAPLATVKQGRWGGAEGEFYADLPVEVDGGEVLRVWLEQPEAR